MASCKLGSESSFFGGSPLRIRKILFPDISLFIFKHNIIKIFIKISSYRREDGPICFCKLIRFAYGKGE